MNRNETGRNGVLRAGDEEYPFTNASFTIEYDTEQSDFNDGLRQYTAYINVHVTGSFELDGSIPKYRDLFIDSTGIPKTSIRMSMDLDEEVINFRDVRINSYGRESPSDGKTSGTVEFEADYFTFGGENRSGAGLTIGPELSGNGDTV